MALMYDAAAAVVVAVVDVVVVAVVVVDVVGAVGVVAGVVVAVVEVVASQGVYGVVVEPYLKPLPLMWEVAQSQNPVAPYHHLKAPNLQVLRVLLLTCSCPY